MSPETRVIIEVLLAVATGASALVIKLTVSQSKSVATDVRKAMESVAAQVKEIGDTVRHHGESLAAGNEKFRGIERRLDEIEAKLEKLITDGCALGRDCLRGSP
jgi:hypothetical protein